MNTKICSSCENEKPLSEFNKKTANVDGHERYCKLCHRERNKNHYNANKQAYKDSARKFRTALRDWFREFKKTLSCERCQDDNYWRLSFHHKDPKEKDSDISSMVANNISRKTIMKEVKKCMVVCHNCHADIHHELNKGGFA